jgi:hypothetical protein
MGRPKVDVRDLQMIPTTTWPVFLLAMRSHALLATLTSILIALLVGCAATTVQFSGMALRQSLCAEGGVRPNAVLYWMPQWRPDQKEPPVREALAQRGVERFAAEQSCVDITAIERWPAEQAVPDNDALLRRAGSTRPAPQLVLMVVVRELGPRLVVGLPVLVEGGTEAVIEARVLMLPSGELLADSRAQWRHGGRFVIKGIGSLDADLSAALKSALLMEPPAKR